MATAIDDLWPSDIAASEGEVPPIAILKQQASLLGQRTKNLLEAEVKTETDDFQRMFKHTLILVAPALNFYRYPLLAVEHHVTKMYPATIKVTWLDKPPGDTILEISARNEEAFKSELRRVLGDDETKRVIATLLAQSTGSQKGWSEFA